MFPLYINSFSELFSGYNLAIYIGISLLNSFLLCYCSLKFILALQISSYKGKGYFRWLKNPQNSYLNRLMLLCFLGFLFFCLLNMCFSPIFGQIIASYLGFISYILFAILYIVSESKINQKANLKVTLRMIRLAIVYCVVLAILTFLILMLCDFIAFSIKDEVTATLRYCIICLMPLLNPFVLYFSSLAVSPIENMLKKRYVRLTKQILKNNNLIKIGITGSFGKTSVKEILKCILSQKYRVLATPESYNTPVGIAITAKKVDSTHDIFIAEMGARKRGDIKELCDIVNPSIGVLTGINEQHLETFKDIETIKQTKFELFENENINGFFSSDNEGSVELFNKFDGSKTLAGLNGKDFYATDVVNGKNGTTFNLHYDKDKIISCSTVLLGKHAISNICLASSVAYSLGLSGEEIATGINKIQSIGHRLEILPNNKGVVIIDDSYNSNTNGVMAAMEVLSQFQGRKIVLTPGLVELGKIENQENYKLGKTLSENADIVIVIGKHNAEMIVQGLIDGGMAKENIKFAKSLNRGNEQLNEIIKEGDIILFENDLPDNYS